MNKIFIQILVVASTLITFNSFADDIKNSDVENEIKSDLQIQISEMKNELTESLNAEFTSVIADEIQLVIKENKSNNQYIK